MNKNISILIKNRKRNLRSLLKEFFSHTCVAQKFVHFLAEKFLQTS